MLYAVSMADTNENTADTFDLIGFLEGSAFPTGSKKVQTDQVIAQDIKRTLDDANMKDDEKRDRISALIEKADKTSVTFHFQGVPDGKIREIHNEHRDSIVRRNRTLALLLTKVVRGDGAVDEREWDEESIAKLMGVLPPQAQEAVVKEMYEVILASTAYDKAAEAGFPV